ncbi:MAG: hypothetical protein ACRD51_15135 [Candidatus Acidiferrum sp.]
MPVRFALLSLLDYDFHVVTIPAKYLECDGCGQAATPGHVARRLERLEWATRYRPVHIGTLFLSGSSPVADENFLYAGEFKGEAGRLLEATGISSAGRPAEIVLNEFQRGGFFLTHLLECPLEAAPGGQNASGRLLLQRAPSVLARMRRSLKPKRIILISEMLVPLGEKFTSVELGCPVILDGGKPFGLDSSDYSRVVQRLQETLAAPALGK